jgi:hypothetical protein
LGYLKQFLRKKLKSAKRGDEITPFDGTNLIYLTQGSNPNRPGPDPNVIRPLPLTTNISLVRKNANIFDLLKLNFMGQTKLYVW